MRLSLVSRKFDSAMSRKTTAEQMRLLQELQAQSPGLQARVPSVLDAISYWYTLRTQGVPLTNDSSEETYIRHFDLEGDAKTSLFGLSVPSSRIDDGKPCLSSSRINDAGSTYNATGSTGARLIVG